MIRTNVYLPLVLYSQIQLLARRERKPAAAVIRDLLTLGLAQPASRETVGQALRSLAAVDAHGPADLSARLDDYLSSL